MDLEENCRRGKKIVLLVGVVNGRGYYTKPIRRHAEDCMRETDKHS